MPVINGIYTKDFPNLGRALLDSDLLVIAVVGDDVTYKITKAQLDRQLNLDETDIFNSGDPYDDQYIVISPTITINQKLTFWINSASYVYNTLWTPTLYVVSGELRLKGFPDENFNIQINY